VGETDGPGPCVVLAGKLVPDSELIKRKLPIVKRQYGVYDKTNGTVVICKDRDHALKAAADGDRFIVMRRSVSEWMSDE